MARRKRRNHAPTFKAQVALAAIKADKTLAELAQQHDIHPNQITDWKAQLLERAAQVFEGGPPLEAPDIKTLRQDWRTDLGERFFGKRAHQGGPDERKAMIDRKHYLPIVRQCQALGLARSTAYYTRKPVSPEDRALIRRIDALHLQHPLAGARMLRDQLGQEGRRVGRPRVAGLMAKMGFEALYRKPNTSRRNAWDQVYPYLLRELNIDRPNQVRATDITSR